MIAWLAPLRAIIVTFGLVDFFGWVMNRLLLSGDLYQNRTVLQHRRKLPISPGFSESRAVEKSLSESEIDSAGLCFLFFFAFAWSLFPRDKRKSICDDF